MRIENNQLVVETTYDLSGDLYLRGTAITALPEGLSVGDTIFKDF